MSLTFESAISEAQSIVQPGLTYLDCFVDRIQTCLLLCLQNTAAQALHGSESSLVKKRPQIQPYSSPLFIENSVVLSKLRTRKTKTHMHKYMNTLQTHTSSDKQTKQCKITKLIWRPLCTLICLLPLIFVKDYNRAQVNGPLGYQSAENTIWLCPQASLYNDLSLSQHAIHLMYLSSLSETIFACKAAAKSSFFFVFFQSYYFHYILSSFILFSPSDDPGSRRVAVVLSLVCTHCLLWSWRQLRALQLSVVLK